MIIANNEFARLVLFVTRPKRLLFYEFFFLNPTNKKLKVSIFLIDKFNKSHKLGKSNIEPFGTFMFALDTFSQNDVNNISWITNLPIGRAIVFEKNGDLFDVFHS